jgi:glycosyltransferase involved in cell wall biosynthesis
MRAQAIYLLSEDPLVVTGSFATYVAMGRLKRPFTFLYHNPGWIRARSIPRYLKLLRHFGKNAKLHFITNEESEARWLRLLGQKATCLGHNLHVRDQFFTPDISITKRYDAVYAATMAPYKRIELAREIQRLTFVTYVTHQEEWDLHAYEPRLRHADFNRRFISREEVRECYRSSHVGLALSAAEGAMFSCTEYLLCGLPVVTTPNRGGRNRHLHPDWSKTVAPDPLAIRAAVEDLCKNPPDPNSVRNGVLGLMRRDRAAFADLLATYGGANKNSHDAEIERIWGGELGIEKLAIPLPLLSSRLDQTR